MIQPILCPLRLISVLPLILLKVLRLPLLLMQASLDHFQIEELNSKYFFCFLLIVSCNYLENQDSFWELSK